MTRGMWQCRRAKSEREGGGGGGRGERRGGAAKANYSHSNDSISISGRGPGTKEGRDACLPSAFALPVPRYLCLQPAGLKSPFFLLSLSLSLVLYFHLCLLCAHFSPLFSSLWMCICMCLNIYTYKSMYPSPFCGIGLMDVNVYIAIYRIKHR